MPLQSFDYAWRGPVHRNSARLPDVIPWAMPPGNLAASWSDAKNKRGSSNSKLFLAGRAALSWQFPLLI